MRTKQAIGLVLLLAIGLAVVGVAATGSLAQTPAAKGDGDGETQSPESVLFKGLLKSLSLRKGGSTDTGLQKKTPTSSHPSAGGPQSPLNSKGNGQKATPASNAGARVNPATGLSASPSVCEHCGSAIVAGKCTGGKPGIPCKSPSGSGSGSDGTHGSGPPSDKGMAASQSGSGETGSASLTADGKIGSSSNQSSRNKQSPGNASGSRAENGSGGGRNRGSMPPTPSGGNDPLANAQAIAARAAANLAASQAGGNAGNHQGPILGDLADLLDSVHAGAAVGPGLRWKVVKPAGVGDMANAPAISMDLGDTETRGGGRKAFQLDAGIVRSELLTGPNNPLLVPPEVASVVYVIDCSSSMAGERFNKVARGVIDAVSQMTDQQQFSVLLFNTVAMQIDGGGLIPATAANQKVLANQLSQVMPVGGTDPTDALLIALQMKPETIVAFSDGEFDRSIVQRVTSLNRSSAKRIQINCVGIQSTVSVLRELASNNGPGNYIEVP